MIAVRSFHELRRDAQLIALLAYAPFEHVGNTQLAPDLAQVLVVPLERERRGTTGNLEFLHVGEQVEQLLRDTVGEVLLVLGRAHVDERQHGDGDGTTLCSRLRAGIIDRRALEDVGIDDHEHERRGQHTDDQEIELASRERRDRLMMLDLVGALDPLGRELVGPREDESDRESDDDQNDDE